jgi:hypothetical protein
VVKPSLAVAGPQTHSEISCVYDRSCVYEHSRTRKMVSKENIIDNRKETANMESKNLHLES